MYGASLKDPGSACLVMELVPGGNLHQRIYDRSLPRMTHLDILQVRGAPSCCALQDGAGIIALWDCMRLTTLRYMTYTRSRPE